MIKILEKKDKDNRFIKNWRLISLLNTDMKVISKVLSRRIKGVFPYLNCSNQTAHLKNKFINESVRVISDILEIGKTLALERFNHCLLMQIPQKIVFGIDFVSWIKTILKNQESCIINGGKTTKYFKLERGA